MAEFEGVIGLEFHVQLATRTKLFCACSPRFGDPPNQHTCPVCLGLPGALPVLNGAAVDQAVRLALALGARVQPVSRFDRKHYFYPDLPKGYQITQLDAPLALGGALVVEGRRDPVPLRRQHLEEDAGKIIHGLPGRARESGVDLNRAGLPLLEVVSEPALSSPAEASAAFAALAELALTVGASEANLERGHLRCDANVSLRPAGSQALGSRVELKNLNSYRFLQRALSFEIDRQRALLEAGQSVRQETRGYDEARGETFPQRGKEDMPDYRWMREPDLPPLVLDPAAVEALRAALPEAPSARRTRYIENLGIDAQHARLLASEPPLASLFDAVLARLAPGGGEARGVAAFFAGDLRAALGRIGRPVEGMPHAAEALVALLELVGSGRLSPRAAREILPDALLTGAAPAALADARHLWLESDVDALAEVVDAVLADHPAEAARLAHGEARLRPFFMGQVLKRSGGRAHPAEVARLLDNRLARLVPTPRGAT